ncbi:putative phosphoglycerate mutase [Tepidibacillus fermentans]|uniref:Putative phosphoglycerate mutase n=1 Tax=Tepidibacillus fermentans TaxID=1281767 RepID=A0A4R3KE01_9BACI|nr:putative phosphoglycerate mutase [Tepidibacillus fermentans]
MKTKIFLVRHGQTDWNIERKYQGQQDIPLNEIGKAQALKVADRFFNEFQISAVYSSSLKRAKETAEEIAKRFQLTVQIHDGLRERNFGLLEGKKIEEVIKQYPGIHMGNIEKFGSFDIEPFHLLKSRVYLAVKELAKRHVGESIVLVSHGAAINALLHEVSKGKVGSGVTKLTNTGISRMIYDHQEDQWIIEQINDDSHVDI